MKKYQDLKINGCITNQKGRSIGYISRLHEVTFLSMYDVKNLMDLQISLNYYLTKYEILKY